MLDMRGVARTQDKRMHVAVIIAAIGTEMLLLARSFGGDSHHDLAHHRFVGLIGCRDLHCDGCAALIDQQMDFRACAGAIGRVLAGGLTAQRGRATAAINRLPAPLDVARPIVEAQQYVHYLGEASLLLPGLEAVVDDATGNAKPATMHSFPLAAGSQDIPDTVDNRAGIGWRPARPAQRARFGQQAFDFAPEWTWNTKVIDVRWFCARIAHGVAFLTVSLYISIVSRLRRVVHSF